MLRWPILLLTMIVTSLTLSATVHAREASDALGGAIGIECSGYVHSDGDADQSQGDSDQAVAHHHGTCHGAASLLPVKAVSPSPMIILRNPLGFARETTLGRWSPGPDLRPPIA
jgi:hypothetical protein